MRALIRRFILWALDVELTYEPHEPGPDTTTADAAALDALARSLK